MELGFYHTDRGYWQAITGSVEDLLPTYPDGTINVPLKPSANHEWQNGRWVYVEPPPAPPPSSISRREFYQGLAVAEKITKDEALAAIKTGTIPAALQAMIDSMSDEDAAFKAECLLAGASGFERDNPLVMIFAINEGMSETEVDDFWRLCSSL